MTSNTLISVIICTYNRCESLRDTLRALQGQALDEGESLEIIVVDNNSHDQTKAVVQDAVHDARWPVRYVFEAHQGVNYARNRGIREASGGLIAFTDDDVIPEPSWVQALVDAFATHQADCVGGRILPLWHEQPPAWFFHDALRKKIWMMLALLDHGPAPLVASNLGEDGFVYGANLALRRQALKDVGMFRDELGAQGARKLVGDETELLGRLFRAGKRIVYAPAALVHHKVSLQRLQMRYLRHRAFVGGRSAILTASTPSRHIPLWLIRECISNGVKTLWSSQRDQGQRIAQQLVFWTQVGVITGKLDLRRSSHTR